jgi:hypothetical protein
MARPRSQDAMNRRLYKGLIIVLTAIYRVSYLNRTVLGDEENEGEKLLPYSLHFLLRVN